MKKAGDAPASSPKPVAPVAKQSLGGLIGELGDAMNKAGDKPV